MIPTNAFVVPLLGGPAGGGVSRWPPVRLHQGTHPGRPGLQHELRRGRELGDGAEVRESLVRALKPRPQTHLLPPCRLLGQLDDTEAAFDDFWERHCTKLEQCLQLRHFERHFREVRLIGFGGGLIECWMVFACNIAIKRIALNLHICICIYFYLCVSIYYICECLCCLKAATVKNKSIFHLMQSAQARQEG